MMVIHTCVFISSVEQIQLDFVEMLRARDEKRRIRHVETLRRQKEEGEDEASGEGEVASGGGGGARVELLGDLDEEQGSASSSVKATSKPKPPLETASYSHSSSNSSTNITNRQVRRESLVTFHYLDEHLTLNLQPVNGSVRLPLHWLLGAKY